MKLAFAKWLSAFALAVHAVPAVAAGLPTGEAGSFVFTDKGVFSDKPLAVYYYKARSAGPQARVLFSMHGVERNGKRARDNWIDAAEKYGLIVLAPEFDQARFPNKLYQLGGMEEGDSARWTFNLIENIFEEVRTDEVLAAPSYMLFGHSAGAQFVHRFALLMPNARLAAAVTGNAGSYTMPVYPTSMFDIGYPWVLAEKRADTEQLKAALGRRLVVLLGEKDVETDSPELPRSREALAQGAHRLERGQRFYAAGKAQAEKMGTPFRWQLVTVPDTGHNSRAMSRAAARVLFENGTP